MARLLTSKNVHYIFLIINFQGSLEAELKALSAFRLINESLPWVFQPLNLRDCCCHFGKSMTCVVQPFPEEHKGLLGKFWYVKTANKRHLKCRKFCRAKTTQIERFFGWVKPRFRHNSFLKHPGPSGKGGNAFKTSFLSGSSPGPPLLPSRQQAQFVRSE